MTFLMCGALVQGENRKETCRSTQINIEERDVGAEI
uniref:Uncharacterized protein n=1 Tax=Globisporangium ultimum (strain ATCC 200006 / CBS 805.95 / DAOM BR144) TaxID=431595 RepID=K3X872_GLOUD